MELMMQKSLIRMPIQKFQSMLRIPIEPASKSAFLHFIDLAIPVFPKDGR